MKIFERKRMQEAQKFHSLLEDELDVLLLTPNKIEIMHTFVKEYSRIWAQKEMEFWIALQEKIKKSYLDAGFIFLDHYSIWVDEDGKARKAEDVLDAIEFKRNKTYENIIGFELQRECPSGVSQHIELYQYSNKFYIYISFLEAKGDEIAIDKNIQSYFASYTFFKPHNRLIKFKNLIFYSPIQEAPSYELFDAKKFDEHLDAISQEIKDVIQTICILRSSLSVSF